MMILLPLPQVHLRFYAVTSSGNKIISEISPIVYAALILMKIVKRSQANAIAFFDQFSGLQ